MAKAPKKQSSERRLDSILDELVQFVDRDENIYATTLQAVARALMRERKQQGIAADVEDLSGLREHSDEDSIRDSICEYMNEEDIDDVVADHVQQVLPIWASYEEAMLAILKEAGDRVKEEMGL